MRYDRRMRSRGYLLTGAVVGTALGALATPIFYEFGSLLPGFTAEGAHDGDAAAKILVIDGSDEAYRNRAVAATQLEPLGTDANALGDPAGATAATPSSTSAPPADAASSPTSAPDPGVTSTSITAPPGAVARTACASLRADNEAKLRIAAGRRSELNAESPARYQVVVTLVAAQSSEATAENENRLNGLAAIAEVNRADFQATADGRYRAPMSNRGLCRALFLRTVVAIEVGDPIPDPVATMPPVGAAPATTTPANGTLTPRP